MLGPAQAATTLPEEVPVAIVVNGGTHAVMMATPRDLEDFAVGFILSEGLAAVEGILDVAVSSHAAGMELNVWLADPDVARLRARRRAMAGPVGCGLCGIDSLAEAMPAVRHVTLAPAMTSGDVADAVAALRRAQPLRDLTGAVHGAGHWVPGAGYTAVREDVGRHNATDKLIGALARMPATAAGALVLTSRVSVELVQKAAAADIGCIVAMSAPTTLAVDLARRSGIRLIGKARGQGHVVYTDGTALPA
jgi:FdhD protein